MRKWILPLLVGWGIAYLFSPRDFLGMFKRAA